MRIRVLQHVPFEGLGCIEPWLVSRGAEILRTHAYRGDPSPDPDSFDGLIVLGGPMSVNDADRHPWIEAERDLVGRAVEDGRTVLGICLGAQMIASAFGMEVYPGDRREIGWWPVRRAEDAERDPLGAAFPERWEAFHWHGETFDLPPGAVRLASSEGCRNQAFSLGPRTLALQFHLETTPAAAAALIENCPGDLRPGEFVRNANEILRDETRFRRANARMRSVLDRLWAEGRE